MWVSFEDVEIDDGTEGQQRDPTQPIARPTTRTDTPVDDFETKLQTVERRMAEAGYPVMRTSRQRTAEEQAALYAQGRGAPGPIVTNARPGQSRHETGTAVDFAFDVGGKPSWDESHPWELIGQYAKEEGLEWGGDFKDINDRPHVQQPGGAGRGDVVRMPATAVEPEAPRRAAGQIRVFPSEVEILAPSEQNWQGLTPEETEAASRAAIQAQAVEQRRGKPREYRPTLGEVFGRGVDIVQSGIYGGIEAGAELVGADEIRKWASTGRTRNAQEAAAAGRLMETSDIHSFGDFAQYIGETVAEQIPIMAPSMAGGLAGGAVGSLAGPVGTTIGAAIGAFAPNFVMSVGEVQAGIKERDPNAVAPGTAFIGGSAIAALDSVLPGKIGSFLVKKFGREAAEQIAKRTLLTPFKEGAKGGLTETFTEGVQEAIGDYAAATATGQKISPDLPRRVFEAGVKGGVMGGLFGGAAGMVPDRKPAPADERTPPPPPGTPTPEARQPGEVRPEEPAGGLSLTMPTTPPPGEGPAGGAETRPPPPPPGAAPAGEIDIERTPPLPDLVSEQKRLEEATREGRPVPPGYAPGPGRGPEYFGPEVEAGLKALGYDNAEIQSFTPEQAAKILQERRPPIPLGAVRQPLPPHPRGLEGFVEEQKAVDEQMRDIERARAEQAEGRPPVPRETGTRPTVASIGEAQAGDVAYAAPEEIAVDPERFQFKGQADTAGVTPAGRLEGPWNENLAGIILAWRDPADGKVYVVNGHHRLEAAQRLGAGRVLVRLIDAPNEGEARLQGALTNIAEERGTPVDVAKVLRGSDMDADALRQAGVSPRTRLFQDGTALAKLSDPLFQRVATGELAEAIGVAVGKADLSPENQAAVVQLVEQQSAKGRELTPGQVSALIEDVKAEPEVAREGEQPDIFSTLLGEERKQSVAVEKAVLRDWLKGALAKDKRLFAYVSKGERAGKLQTAGVGTIDVEAGKAQAQQAAVVAEVFERLSQSKGPVNAALTEAATRLAKGDPVAAVRHDLLNAVRKAVESELAGARPEAKPGGREEGRPSDEGVDQAGRRPAEEPRVEPEHKYIPGGPADHGTARIGTRGNLEVTFPGKPTQKVIDALKAAGFEYNKKEQVYWAPDSAERRRAIAGFTSTEEGKPTEKVKKPPTGRTRKSTKTPDAIASGETLTTRAAWQHVFGLPAEEAEAAAEVVKALDLDTKDIVIQRGGPPPTIDRLEQGAEGTPRERVAALADGRAAGTKQVPFPHIGLIASADLFQLGDVDRATLADIPLDKLVMTQPSVDTSTVNRYLDVPMQRLTQPPRWGTRLSIPIVREFQGKYYVEDGHNRVVAEWAKNAKTVQALVVPVRGAAARREAPALLYQTPENASEMSRWYYSNTARALDTWQPKGTIDQLLAHLKKFKGVQEEATEMGLFDWLETFGRTAYKGTVTREQIRDFLDERQIEFGEITKGKPLPDDTYQAFETLKEAGYVAVSIPNQTGSYEYELHHRDADGGTGRAVSFDEYHRLPRDVKDAWNDIALTAEMGRARYPSQVLPGGTRYREYLFTWGPKESELQIPKQKVEPNGEGYWDITFEGYRPGTSMDGAVIAWERTPYAEGPRKQPFPEGGNGPGTFRAYFQYVHKVFDDKDEAIAWVLDAQRKVLTAEARRKQTPEYRTGHWEEPNVFAHLRVDDRLVGGKKILFIEEIQSDLHQKGRKVGYQSKTVIPSRDKAALVEARKRVLRAIRAHDPDLLGFDTAGEAVEAIVSHDDYAERWQVSPETKEAADAWRAMVAEERRLDDLRAQDRTAVPNAPFKNHAWKRLALKKALALAAEGGYDGVAWTTGEQQNARYRLSAAVDSIEWQHPIEPRIEAGGEGGWTPQDSRPFQLTHFIEGDTSVWIKIKDTHDYGRLRVNKQGEIIGVQFDDREKYLGVIRSLHGRPLDEAVGKELAKRILDEKEGKLEGTDLDVGGRGMIGFYDRELPNFANDIAKPYGQKAGMVSLSHRNRSLRVQLVPRVEGGGNEWTFFDHDAGDYWTDPETGHQRRFTSRELAQETLARMNAAPGETVHFLATPAEMREAIRDKGLPLYQGEKAAVEFAESGKVIIHAFANADVSSAVHELAHIVRRQLLARNVAPEQRVGITDEDIQVAEEWAGAKDGVWNRDAEEKFARGFERYLRDGIAPTERLKAVFAKFAQWLSEIYQNLKGSSLDIDISPEMRKVFDKLVTRGERKEAVAALKDIEAVVGEPRVKYASTEVRLPADLAQQVRALGEAIPEEDLAEGGREEMPHVTVKYGIHGEKVDPIRALLKGEGPVTVQFSQTDYFETPEADVLHIVVKSDDLARLNAKIAEGVETTDTHPTYKPHVTIAYLKPGLGRKYAGDVHPLEGRVVTLDEVTFSPVEGPVKAIPLTTAPEPTPGPKPSGPKIEITKVTFGRKPITSKRRADLMASLKRPKPDVLRQEGEAPRRGIGFVGPDGTEHRAKIGADVVGRQVLGGREDHTDMARRLLGDQEKGGVKEALRAGYVRFWVRTGEVDLNFAAKKPETARNALEFLRQNYQPGDRIYLDIEGAPEYLGKFFDNLREANQAIRVAGGLPTDAGQVLRQEEELDPDTLGKITEIVETYVEEGKETLPAIQRAFEAEFGEGAAEYMPYLQAAWRASREAPPKDFVREPAAPEPAPVPPKVDEGGFANESVGFGKYAGIKVKDLAKTDPGYATWLFENGTSPRAKLIREYLAKDPVFMRNKNKDAVTAKDAVTDDAKKVLAPFGLAANPEIDGTVQLSGRTYDWREEIKKAGGRWDGETQSWKVPAGNFAGLVDVFRRTPVPRGGRRLRDAPYKSNPELQRLRDAAEGRPDDSQFNEAVESFVRPETQALIRLGLNIGMPPVVVDEQIEDVARINRAYQKNRRLFVLASEPGSGKTFVLGGAIRELRRAGAKRITYVTMRQELISQIRKDLADYDIGNVNFITYPMLRKAEPQATDVLIFDEAHSIKNVDEAAWDKMTQANAAANWIGESKYTILSSATPFENPVEMEYLEPTGIFNDQFGSFDKFALAFGASEIKIDEDRSLLSWRRTTSSDEDSKAARDWLIKSGIYTSRRIRLPENQVDSRLVKFSVPPEHATRYKQITDAAADQEDKLAGFARAWVINFQKRLLEAAKVSRAIEEAAQALARGRYPIIFVETKAERRIDIPHLLEKEQEWAIAVGIARMQREKPPARKEYGLPPQGVTDVLATYMQRSGQSIIEIPSAEDLVQNAFPDKVAIFTGSVSPSTAQKNLDTWRKGTKPVLVATMAKGGTGLSLHDKVGDHQTTQINLNLPWTATGVVQVAQRSARYGLKGQAEMEWIFAENIPFDRKLASKVGGRMADMGALVHGERLPGSAEIEDWNFEDLSFAEASDVGEPKVLRQDPEETDQERSFRERAEFANLVAQNPDSFSTQDLLRAAGHWSDLRQQAIRRGNDALLESVDRELQVLDIFIKQRAKATDEARAAAQAAAEADAKKRAAIKAKFEADIAARRQQIEELGQRFEKDGYLYGTVKNNPHVSYFLSRSAREDVNYQVTVFADGIPTGHHDYQHLGTEENRPGSSLDWALAEFRSLNLSTPPELVPRGLIVQQDHPALTFTRQAVVNALARGDIEYAGHIDDFLEALQNPNGPVTQNKATYSMPGLEGSRMIWYNPRTGKPSGVVEFVRNIDADPASGRYYAARLVEEYGEDKYRDLRFKDKSDQHRDGTITLVFTADWNYLGLPPQPEQKKPKIVRVWPPNVLRQAEEAPSIGLQPDDTVTLLHGTTKLNADLIRQHGFRPGTPHEIAAGVEKEYGLPAGSVERHVAFEFARNRRDLDYAHFTTDESIAAQYTIPEVVQDALRAVWMLQHPAEDETRSRHQEMTAWVKQEGRRLAEPEVLAVNMPWSAVGEHGFGRKISLEEFKTHPLLAGRLDSFANISLPISALREATVKTFKTRQPLLQEEDILSTGERQPRLPGEVGAVRDREVHAPQLRSEAELSVGYSPAAMRLIFGLKAPEADAADAIIRHMGLNTNRVRFAKSTPVPEQGGLFQVEDPLKLSVLHNLSSENLVFADQMGGLAVPSMGLVRGTPIGERQAFGETLPADPHGMSIEGFGDITLIGRKNLGDPKQVEVFDADIYSTRFPKPEYPKAPSAVAQKVFNAFKPFAEKFDDRGLYHEMWDNAVDSPDPQATISRMRQRYANAAQAWFLKEKHGIDVEPIMKPRTSRYGWNWEKPFVDFVNREDFDRSYDVVTQEATEPITAAIDSYLAKKYRGKNRDIGEAVRNSWLKDVIDPATGLAHYGPLMRAKDDVQNKGKDIIDGAATDKVLADAMKGKEREFYDWSAERILAMHGPPFLRIGRQRVPFTLQNAVDVMLSTKVKAAEKTMTFGEGMARAAAARPISDLTEARNRAEWQITQKSELEEERTGAKKALEGWRDKVVPYRRYFSRDNFGSTWEGLDASMRALARWARRGGPAALRDALRREDFVNVPEWLVQEGVEAGKQFMNVRVPYFEVKPHRAVQLEEFAGAVIPEDASEDVKAVLDRRGIPYTTYTPRHDEAARRLAVDGFRNELAGKGADVLFMGTKAAVEFAEDGSAIIRALNKPDISSVLHEFAHVARRQLFDRRLPPQERAGVTDEDIATAEAWAGATGGVWTREAEEKFARGFERYLRDGQAPTQNLQTLFDKIAKWLAAIYQTIKGSSLDVDITPSMRRVFDRLVTRAARIEAQEIANSTKKIERVEKPVAQDLFGAGQERLFQFAGPVDSPSFQRWFGNSKIVNPDGTPKVVYHGTFADFDVFEKTADIGFHFGTVKQATSFVSEGALPSEKTPQPAQRPLKYGKLMPVYLKMEKPIRLPDLGTWDPDSVLNALVTAGVIEDVEMDEITERAGWRSALPDTSRRAIRELLQTKGYDGIIYMNVAEGTERVRAMPEDIKEEKSDFYADGVKLVSDTYGELAEAPTREAAYNRVKQRLKFGEIRKADDSYIVFSPTQVKSAIGNVGAFDPNAPSILFQEDEDAKRAVSLVRQYVNDDYTLAQAIQAFNRDMGDKARAYKRTFEIAWQSLTGEQPPSRVGNINLAKFPLPNDVKRELALIIEQNDEYIEQRRGVRSWAMTREAAEALPPPKRVPHFGAAFNAEELEALAGHIITVREQLDEVTAKVAAGQQDQNTLIRQAQLLSQEQVLLETYAGTIAEAGRALNILRKIREGIQTTDDALLRAAIRILGGQKMLASIAKALQAFDKDDLVGKYAFIRSLQRATISDWLSWYWYTNLLSGPLTHGRNLLGNTSQLTFKALSKPASAGVDTMRSLVTGTPRAVEMGELGMEWVGFKKGVTAGLQKAAFLMRHGFTMEDVTSNEIRPPEVPGGIYTNFIGRFLEASDLVVRSMHAMSELYAQAYTAAKNKGLQPGSEEWETWTQQFIANPPVKVLTAINREAARLVFRGEPGPFVSALMKSRDNYPITLPNGKLIKIWNPIKFIIPFVQTPANIFKMSLEATPLGFGMAFVRETPRERVESAGRALLGSALLLPLAMLVAEGFVSGSGPDDKEQRDQLYRTGWQPNSIRINGTWYNYSNFQPLALPLSILANAYEAYIYSGNIPDGGAIIARTLRTTLQQSYLSGLSSLQEALENPDVYASAAFRKIITSLVPLSSLRGQIARAVDPVVRQPATIGEAIKAGQPGTSTWVRPRLTALGEEAERGGNVLTRLFSPVTVSKVKDTPLERELYRLRNDIQIGFPGRTVTIRGETHAMTPDEYDYMLRESGQRIKVELERRTQPDAGWMARSDERKVEDIRRIVNEERDSVRRQVVRRVRERLSAAEPAGVGR